MTTRIGKNEAKVLEGIALVAFTDTRETLKVSGGSMQTVYAHLLSLAKGRDVAHVKYLTSCYTAYVAADTDGDVKAAKGSVGQIMATINRLTKEGRELPEKYGEARKMAYPTANRAPRMPGETAAPSEGTPAPSEGTTDASEGTPATEPARQGRTLSSRMSQLVGFLLEMEADEGEAFAYAEQAIRNAYAEWTIERSLAADAAESLDMAEEA